MPRSSTASAVSPLQDARCETPTRKASNAARHRTHPGRAHFFATRRCAAISAATPDGGTALDRYVAAPDANFAWKAVRELPAEGVTATLLEMTSQKWLTENGPNTWVARVARPPAGWTAFFAEMTFPSGGKYPLKVCA
jgi:hypothetical protein